MTASDHTGRAFGLWFHSSRALPELSFAEAAPAEGPRIAIEWRMAEPPGSPDRPDPPAEPFVDGDGLFHLLVPGVARFEIAPDRIVVRPLPGVDERSVRAYLFGSAVGALLQLRGLTVLHGSAVGLPDGSAAVFCGQSTAGKSTLAAALAARGYAVLADDLCAVRLDTDGQAWCLPGLARTKLWRDALDTLGLAARADASTRIVPEFDKHSLSLAVAEHALPLRRFYELQVSDAGALEYSAVTGLHKLTLLMTHAYRPAYLHAMGLEPALLRNAATLARQLQAARIARPRGQATLDEIIAWLEQHWRS